MALFVFRWNSPADKIHARLNRKWRLKLVRSRLYIICGSRFVVSATTNHNPDHSLQYAQSPNCVYISRPSMYREHWLTMGIGDVSNVSLFFVHSMLCLKSLSLSLQMRSEDAKGSVEPACGILFGWCVFPVLLALVWWMRVPMISEANPSCGCSIGCSHWWDWLSNEKLISITHNLHLSRGRCSSCNFRVTDRIQATGTVSTTSGHDSMASGATDSYLSPTKPCI